VKGTPDCPTFAARISLGGHRNIVHHDMLTSKTTVIGTLSCMQTEFGLLGKCSQTYDLQLSFTKPTSMARLFAEKLVGAVACASLRDHLVAEEMPNAEIMAVEEDLCWDFCNDDFAEVSTVAGSDGLSAASDFDDSQMDRTDFRFSSSSSHSSYPPDVKI